MCYIQFIAKGSQLIHYFNTLAYFFKKCRCSTVSSQPLLNIINNENDSGKLII